MDQAHIRNFCIIAHIDHGKSTLADRLLEHTGTLSARQMTEQVLDQMDLERERGITIKLQPVQMSYQAKDGLEYQLNLIDTPGHVDFSYEVSRSLAACEGAILVIDATQGIQAQTIANVYLALEHDLALVPVINKIDLPNADPEGTIQQIQRVLGFRREEIILASAKEGIGIPEILEAIIAKVPRPTGDPKLPLRALIFDSKYDLYKGVITYVRVMEGTAKANQRLLMMMSGTTVETLEVGIFLPFLSPGDELAPGQVGYIATGLKNVREAQVGDTITETDRPAKEALPGYHILKPMVFAGLYPSENGDFPLLRDALDKLKLNDAALSYEPENSVALGPGFRCGFLGLLHMEVVQERLEREYDLNLIITAPGVEYQLLLTNGSTVTVDNPARMPPPQQVQEHREPWMEINIMTPSRFVGTIMDLVTNRDGIYQHMEYMDGPASSGNVHKRGGRRPAGAHPLPPASLRDAGGLLRRPKVSYPGLRFLRLRVHRVPESQAGEAGRAGERAAGGRLIHDLAGQQGAVRGPQAGGATAHAHPPPDVRRADTGSHRRPGCRTGDGAGHAEERASQMLRRRH